MKKSFIKNRDAVTDAYIIVAATEMYSEKLDEDLEKDQNWGGCPPDCEGNAVRYLNEVIKVHNHYQKIISLHEYKMDLNCTAKGKLWERLDAEFGRGKQAQSETKKESKTF